MGWSMGWDVKDDGRTLRPVQKDEYEYAGGISEMPALVPPSDARQAFLFRDQKLIPEALQVHSENFAATEWEAQYSNLTGSGDKQSFTPVINDSYRIVGHLGWIVINEIYVSKNTIAEGTPTAVALEMARLAEWHRQRVWSHDHPINFFGAQPARGTKPPVPCWPANRSSGASLKPLLSEADRKSFLNGPGVDPSDELRLRENMNFYLAGGGKAIVGTEFAWEFQDRYIGELRPGARALLQPTQFCDFWDMIGIYRCLALVAPNGHLQEVFEVQKIHFESRAERADRIALQVLDIALTIWMMIDMVTIPVALFSLAGRLLAREVMIEAVRVTVRGEVKAAVDLALREVREAAGAEAKLARALPGPLKDFPFGSGRGPLPVPEAPNKVYRIMSMDEAAQALKARKLPPHLPGKESARFVSLDSKYAMLFREKELADLSKLGVGIEKAEANLAMVEKRLAAVRAAGGDTAELEAKADALRAAIDNRGLANRATADPVIKEWYEAPGQKVVVEIELEPGALDDILGRSVETNVFQKYHGKDVYLWKLERGYGRNIGIPTWQIDAFNSRIRNIRFYGERGLKLVGERKLPGAVN
jgi:hypothetical protein